MTTPAELSEQRKPVERPSEPANRAVHATRAPVVVSNRRGELRRNTVLFMVWAVLAASGWLVLRPIAISQTLAFTLKAPTSSTWALEWTRASDGARNGVWIDMPSSGELLVTRRLPAYAVSDIKLRRESGDGFASVDDATCGTHIFGIASGKTDVPTTFRDGTVVFADLPRADTKVHAIGLALTGTTIAAAMMTAIGLFAWWRRRLARLVTPQSIAWALVISTHVWLAIWAPILYCPDSMGYLAGAIRLLREGSLAGFEGPRVPGFGIVLAGLWALPGEFGLWLGMLHALLGLGTSWLAWRIAKKILPSGWSEAALVLVGCSPLLLGWQRFVMSETLSAFLVVLAVWLAMRGERTTGASDDGFGRAALWACVLGLVCAAGAYVRGNLQLLIVLVPILLGVVAWRRWGLAGAPVLAAIAFAVGVACVLPRVMWNLGEYGEAKLVVGEGYQRNLTTQMTGVMDDNQSGMLGYGEWQSLTRERETGKVDAYSAQDFWMKSDLVRAPAGLKGWSARSAKLDVPAMESIAREPARAMRVAALGTLNILGLWRTERWGFSENEYWSRPLRGIRPSTVERDGSATNMWTGHDIVEGMSSLSTEDRELLWTRTNRDVTRAISLASARLFARWWSAEDTFRPVCAGFFFFGAIAALIKRDWIVLLLATLVIANATALATLTLSGIDRYGVPFEALLRVVAAYGAWRACVLIQSETGASAAPTPGR